MSDDFRNPNPENLAGADSPFSQELDWLAFRYVSDEMPAAERGEFEKRLETDEAAQLALVDVMRSTQVIYAALDSQKTKVQRSDRSKAKSKSVFQRYSSVLAAAAAILLMVVGWTIYSGIQDFGFASNSQNSTDLAIAWADTLTARELVKVEGKLDELAEETEFEDFVSYDSPGESGSWMYTALVDIEESVEVPK